MTDEKELHVCVLGAGVCGIVATKICIENGFIVECYEKSPHYGGLWHYHEESKLPPGEPFIPSVMKSTILNTTKELSAFSDFPPPADYPNNMKHELYMQYIDSYVQNFKLTDHIHLKHEVVKCELKKKRQTSDKFEWIVTIRNLEQNTTVEKNFDKLMLATGHHNRPYLPTMPEQHKFEGEIIHSGRIKNVINETKFHGKRVVVVGFGNSACDIANDLALVADKTYLSSHRGNWFLSRVGSHGITEHCLKTRFSFFAAKFVSLSMVNKRILSISKGLVDHDFLGVTPKHQPVEQVPIINDLFPYRVYTGGITMKSSILRLTENGVVFEGEEDTEYPIDIIVLATGYTVKMDFLDEYKLGLKSMDTNEYELYMNVFAPKLRVEISDENLQTEAIKSLAFIGHVQVAGSLTVVSELQSRWACLVFANKLKLPKIDEMLKSYEQIRRARMATIRSQSKDVLMGDWMSYIDDIAKLMGVKPKFTRLLMKDFKLWHSLMFGPFVPYQYRLFGPGKWSGAREVILGTQDRIERGVNDGKNYILFKTRKRCLPQPSGSDTNNNDIGTTVCTKE